MATAAKRVKKNKIPVESLIGKLSNDVLLEVFEFLDGKSLKKASLVCKNWNNVIGLSKATMKKLPLKYKEENVAEVLKSKRNWVSMKANLWNCDPAKFAKFIENFGVNLDMLIVDGFKSFPEDLLRKVLKNVPSLKSLELTYITVTKSTADKPTAPINFSQLAKLKLHSTGSRVLEMLSAPRLTTFAIIDSPDVVLFNNLTTFLKSIPKLKTLSCDSNLLIESLEASKEGFPFKLKSFHCLYLRNHQETGVCKFLLSQSSSIEEIYAPFKSRESFSFLLTEMKSLRIWHINLSSLPMDQLFYLQLKPTAIKEIKSSESFSNEAAARGFLNHFPDLECLDLAFDCIVPKMLPFLTIRNPKLKSLTIKNLGTAEARLPALKNLVLLNFGNRSRLESFLKRNPTIENLTLDFNKEHCWHTAEELNFLNEYGFKSLAIKGYRGNISENIRRRSRRIQEAALRPRRSN